jgi:hypothetical protein
MKHEQSNVSARGLFVFVFWFVVAVGVIHGIVYGIYVGLVRTWQRQVDVPNTALVSDLPVPPDPRLQPSLPHDRVPRVDVELMFRENREEFARRGWVDKAGQVVIPDDVAEKVINSLPRRPGAAPQAAAR